MPRPRRRLPGSAVLALVLLALVASGCSLLEDDDAEPGATGSAETTLPSAATLLRVASADWPGCLNPLTCTDDTARTLVLQHVVPKLMEVDAAGGYVPSPVLAGAPEVRVDRATGEQTIVFVLAEEARWHDGRPITSSDVKGTWMAHLGTPGAATPGHQLISAVDDTDPLVARVTLRSPWADWPELFGGHEGWLLHADAFGGDTDLTGRFDDLVPFGAGPYELVSFEERSLILVARDDHWDPDRQAQIDQVRIDHFPSIAATDGGGPDASVPGGIDLVIPGVDLPAVPDRFALRTRPTAAVVGLLFDRRTAPLGSAGVRAAVAEALDRRELVELAGVDPSALVTCAGWLPGDPACGDDMAEEGASVEAADLLLELDGWPVLAGGGRGRPGLPLATPVSYDPTIGGADRIAAAVVDALVGRGFAATAQPVTAETWLRRDRQEGVGIGVYAPRLGTAARVASLYGCGAAERNPLAWCDPAVEDLLAQLLAAPDRARRDAVAAELAALAASSRSWLPLHQRETRWLVDPARIEVPDDAPLGSGPLGALHAHRRADR
ncbi:MAG: ABC transporter substrate-binding protein [Acidimicrobiia bacterium]